VFANSFDNVSVSVRLNVLKLRVLLRYLGTGAVIIDTLNDLNLENLSTEQ
jgi:hypothetical protein